MSRCLTWFDIGDLGEPNIYHDLERITRKWGFYLEGSLTGKNQWGLLTEDDIIDFF